MTRLSAALILAVTSSVALLHYATAPENLAQHESNLIALEQRVGDIGLAAFGSTFFDNSTGSKLNGLINFGEKIFPYEQVEGTSSPGILYPARRFFAAGAYIFAFPIVIFSLLHLVITKGGVHVRDLAVMGVHFVFVVIALAAYPKWDSALYKGLTIPLVTEFENGDLAKNMIASAMGDPNATVTGPTTALLTYSQRGLDCTAKRAQEASDYQSKCLEGTTDDMRRVQEGLDRSLISPEDLAALSNDEGKKKGVIDKVVAKTTQGLLGAVLIAQQLAMVVIIWFAWLAMIAARAISASLAPFMLVWALLPGQWDKFYGWFKGHAKIVLQPIGFTLGLLIIWVMQLGIMTTDLLDNNAPGLAIRVAMLIFFFLATLKLKGVIDQAGADVTKIAASVGGSVQSMAVTAATTLGSAAAIAGTGGVAAAGGLASGLGSAAVKSAGRTRVGSAIGGAISRGRERIANLGGSSRTQEREFGQKGRTPLSRLAATAGKTVSMGASGVRNSASILANAYKNSINKLDLPHIKQLGSTLRSEAKGEASAKHATGQAVYSRLFNTQAQRGPVSFSRDAVERSAAATRAIDHMGAPTPLRPGESIESIKVPANIKIVASALEHDQIRKWAPMLDDIDVLLSSEEKDGKVRPVMTQITLEQLRDKWDNDRQFRQQMEARFGEIPMVTDDLGNQQPDFAALMEDSTVFANMLLAGSAQTEARYEEMYRRDSVSKAAAVQPGSVEDLVLRSLPAELTAKTSSESDDEYGARLRSLAQEFTALAHAKVTDTPTLTIDAVRSDPSVVAERIERIEHMGWANPNAFESAPAEGKASISRTVEVATAEARAMYKRAEEATVTHKGVTYGMDLDTFVRSGGRETQWVAHDDSLYSQVSRRLPETATQREIFEKAKELALQDLQITEADIEKFKPQKQREVRRELYRKMFAPPTEE